MKTLQELYTEVMASDEMKKEFIEAFQTKEATESALKKYGCEASFEEFQAFMKEKQENDELVSEEDVKAIAGGGSKLKNALFDTGLSLTTYGMGCLVKVAVSEYKALDHNEISAAEAAKCKI